MEYTLEERIGKPDLFVGRKVLEQPNCILITSANCCDILLL